MRKTDYMETEPHAAENQRVNDEIKTEIKNTLRSSHRGAMVNEPD